MLLDEMLQRLALEILHCDESATIFLTDIVNGADVGVAKSRCGLCFSLETGKCMHVFRNIVREEFQGNKTMEARVLGSVNDTHTAAAELFKDAVVRDGLANHC